MLKVNSQYPKHNFWAKNVMINSHQLQNNTVASWILNNRHWSWTSRQLKTESRRKAFLSPVSLSDKRTVIAALGHSCLPFSFHQRFPPIRPMCHLSPFVLPPGHFHSPMCLSTTLSPLLRAGHKQVRQSTDRVNMVEPSWAWFLHSTAPLTTTETMRWIVKPSRATSRPWILQDR